MILHCDLLILQWKYQHFFLIGIILKFILYQNQKNIWQIAHKLQVVFIILSKYLCKYAKTLECSVYFW